MRADRLLALLLAILVAPAAAMAASPVHKCIVDGVVTFQSAPCAVGEKRPQPTARELNAQRAKALPSKLPAGPASGAVAVPALSPAAAAPAAPGFRCDGRTHCSQMTSCAEARFFLAHCPNVEMDGNGDGVPCERQWCRRR